MSVILRFQKMADTWIWKKDRFVAEVHRSVFSASRADFGSSSSRTRRKLECHLCLSPRDLARLGFRLAFSPSSPVWEKKWRDIDIKIFVSQVKGCGNKLLPFWQLWIFSLKTTNETQSWYLYVLVYIIYMICNTSSSLGMHFEFFSQSELRILGFFSFELDQRSARKKQVEVRWPTSTEKSCRVPQALPFAFRTTGRCRSTAALLLNMV